MRRHDYVEMVRDASARIGPLDPKFETWVLARLEGHTPVFQGSIGFDHDQLDEGDIGPLFECDLHFLQGWVGVEIDTLHVEAGEVRAVEVWILGEEDHNVRVRLLVPESCPDVISAFQLNVPKMEVDDVVGFTEGTKFLLLSWSLAAVCQVSECVIRDGAVESIQVDFRVYENTWTACD